MYGKYTSPTASGNTKTHAATIGLALAFFSAANPAGSGAKMAVARGDLQTELGIHREHTMAAGVTKPQGVRHVLGDQLKIVFYERLGVSSKLNQRSGSSSANLVERAELTGVYTVQADGQIVLPILGSIAAEGKTTAELEQRLEAIFQNALGREARASVLLEERQPIYFVDRRKQSGTLKYTPGMTVLHAVASAGASEDVRSDVYVRMERLRERERQEKAREKLKPLHARLAVLTAEAAGKEAKPQGRLTSLVGEKEANAAVEVELQRRRVILDSQRPMAESYTAVVAVAKQEKANLLTKLAIVEESIKNHGTRNDAVESLRSRGNASGYLTAQVKSELANARVLREDILNQIAVADLKVTQAEKDLNKLIADTKAERERELRTVESEVKELEATLIGTQRMIDDLDLSVYRTSADAERQTFEIVRRTSSGSEKIKADELTELRPGDLVRVVVPQGDKSVAARAQQ